MPIVPWWGDDALVLLPLCQIDDVQRLVGRLEEIIPSMAIRQISLAAAQLVKLYPPVLLVDPGPPATPSDERTRLRPTSPTVESA
jgi:hypothetical protein